MFLGELSVDQKSAFLGLAKLLTEVDGLTPEETELMRFFEIETGLSVERARTGLVDELAAFFKDRRSQVSILLELIALGYSDDDFTAEESGFISQLISMFGLAEEELAIFENWVLRQLSLYEEAEALRASN